MSFKTTKIRRTSETVKKVRVSKLEFFFLWKDQIEKSAPDRPEREAFRRKSSRERKSLAETTIKKEVNMQESTEVSLLGGKRLNV